MDRDSRHLNRRAQRRPSTRSVALIVEEMGPPIAKVLWSPDENLNPDDYEIVGLLGTVCSPIRQNGTGEILFSQAGARRVAGARSEGGAAIDKGVEVVITRYQNGLAYVRTWTEHASEEAI